jgi:DNA-binding transcriptional regulator LsrR (DeoR family)
METKAMREIEEREGEPIREVLVRLYQQHRTQQEVAESLGISRATLAVWLIRLGLTEKTVLVKREEV